MRRLWIVHPSYLDTWGLCTLWRDGLICQRKVMRRETTDNPDVLRFQTAPRPIEAMGAYLWFIADFGFYSASERVSLPKWRIESALNPASVEKIVVTPDEVERHFEGVQELVSKRRGSNSDKHLTNMDTIRREGKIQLHPMFTLSNPTPN